MTAQSFHKHRTNATKFRSEFRRIFGLEIRKYYGNDMISIMMGFNIVQFDADVKCPDGVSLKQYLLNKFGQEGHDLIETLIA